MSIIVAEGAPEFDEPEPHSTTRRRRGSGRHYPIRTRCRGRRIRSTGTYLPLMRPELNGSNSTDG